MIKRTPIRIQINPIECGAAVLGIVLGYYKQNIAMHELNQLVGVSRYGSDARALMRAAESLGLKAYAQKILVDDLKKTRELSVLFVDNSHFVVFEGYFWGRFYINDPALGRYNLSAEQLRKRLSGMHIVLEPTDKLVKNQPSASAFLENFMGIITGTVIGIIIFILASVLALNMSEKIRYMSLIIFFLIIITFLGVIFIQISYLKFKSLYSEKLSIWLLSNISESGSNFFTTRPFENFESVLKSLSTLDTSNFSKYYLSAVLAALIFIIVSGNLCYLLAPWSPSEYFMCRICN